jgi:ectoine hydroxylase-related dioxygenase (phytanoyl-CoA dioxygenase family)
MPYDLPVLGGLDRAAIERFGRDGFVIVERFLSAERIEALRERFPRLFAGKFDTGVYPDEWYWREGMSLPDVTRHMANAWKSDLTVARLVLSADIGRAAAVLTGWPGVRLGQDTIWWKAPKTKPIAFHQDSSFLDILDPPQTITCWVTLDDTERDAGTLEYAAGSHLWPLAPLPEAFHAQDDYRAQMRAAAAAAGRASVEPVMIEIPAGSCVFHAGEIWHGSGANPSGDRMRRSIGIHMIRADATFSDRPGGYIYRRYQRTGDPTLDESFFPILWSDCGGRTEWLEHYCETGRRVPSPRSPAARAASA